MPVRNRLSAWGVLLALTVVLLGVNPAMAYIGPGADLGFVGYFMSLLVWVGVAFSATFLWPIYALLRRLRRGKKAKATEQIPTPTAEE